MAGLTEDPFEEIIAGAGFTAEERAGFEDATRSAKISRLDQINRHRIHWGLPPISEEEWDETHE